LGTFTAQITDEGQKRAAKPSCLKTDNTGMRRNVLKVRALLSGYNKVDSATYFSKRSRQVDDHALRTAAAE
jgi:hypothetical protein